jgi:C4-dicarboxylate transporter DctM subunit
MVAVVACMFFAAVSGSAIADAAAIGGILIPTMIANRYHPPFTASLVAAAGTIGPIIPPSIPMVLYGAMTNTSIAMLFAGGFLPGVLMGVSLMLYAYYVGKRRGYRGREKRAGLREVARGFVNALFAMLMPIIIMGDRQRIFTLTNRGGGQLGLGLVYRELPKRPAAHLLRDRLTTGRSSSSERHLPDLTVRDSQQVAAGLSDMRLGWFGMLLDQPDPPRRGTFIDTISALVTSPRPVSGGLRRGGPHSFRRHRGKPDHRDDHPPRWGLLFVTTAIADHPGDDARPRP